MSSKIATVIGKKYLSGKTKKLEPADPYYETYTDAKGRTKKRPRPVPEILNKKDAKLLKKIRKRARNLDNGFSICGFRFGYTFIIGLIPVAGDVAQFALSYLLIVRKAKDADLPSSLISHMVMNQLVGLGIGMVPVLGDIGLAAWKPNTRNAHLLEEFLTKRAIRINSGNLQQDSDDIARQTVKKQKSLKRYLSTGAPKPEKENNSPDTVTNNNKNENTNTTYNTTVNKESANSTAPTADTSSPASPNNNSSGKLGRIFSSKKKTN